MENIIAFEDILKNLDMEHEQFIYQFKVYIDKGLDKEDYKKIQLDWIEQAYQKIENRDFNFKDLTIESLKDKKKQELKTLEVINWDSVKVLSEEYLKLIKNNYYISIEELSRFINIEIQYVQKNIVDKLDRLTFPPVQIKQLMKQHIYSIYKDNTKYNKYMRKIFKNLLRKKILLGINTTNVYLNEHMQEVEEFEIINLKLNKEQFDQLKDKHKYIHTIKISFNHVAKNMKISDEILLEYKNKKIDKFKNLTNAYFKIKQSPEEIEEIQEGKKRFYSISNLKSLFDKIYDIEVLRKLESTRYSKYYLFKNKEQKKPSARYLIDINFIKEILKEVYKLQDAKKQKNENYYIAIPVQVPSFKYYYILKYIENIEEYFIAESLKLNIKIKEDEE